MYFHILLELKKTNGVKSKLLADLNKKSLDDIVEKIFVPYLEKKEININGSNYEYDEIRKITVKQSLNTAEQVAKESSSKVFPIGIFFPYNAEEIIKWKGHTQDITTEVCEMALSKLRSRSLLLKFVIYLKNFFNQDRAIVQIVALITAFVGLVTAILKLY